MYTIASVHKMITAKMHCILGHKFPEKLAIYNNQGCWCPVCGNLVITGNK